MKFVTVRDLRLTPGKVWALAKQENRIVLKLEKKIEDLPPLKNTESKTPGPVNRNP